MGTRKQLADEVSATLKRIDDSARSEVKNLMKRIQTPTGYGQNRVDTKGIDKFIRDTEYNLDALRAAIDLWQVIERLRDTWQSTTKSWSNENVTGKDISLARRTLKVAEAQRKGIDGVAKRFKRR